MSKNKLWYPDGAIGDVRDLVVGNLYFVTRTSPWKAKYIDPIIFHHIIKDVNHIRVYHADRGELDRIRHYSTDHYLRVPMERSTDMKCSVWGFFFENYWLAYAHFHARLRDKSTLD
jgi:hypothetical protein